MKKIIKIAALAAMCLSLVSCEDFLNYLSTVATFQFSGETAYDGQQMVLKRTATCAYQWSVPQGSSYCSVKVYTGSESRAINGQDSTAVATFNMGNISEKAVSVTVRAQNKLYPDRDDYTQENQIEVHQWAIRIHDIDADKDVVQLVDGKKYKLYIKDLRADKPIDKIVFNLAVDQKNRSEEVVEFEFPTSLKKNIISAEDGSYNANTAVMFTVANNGAKVADALFKAKLNNKTVTYNADINM